MKNFVIIGLASLISISCGTSAQQNPAANGANVAVVQSSNAANVRLVNDSAIVSSHSTDAPDKPVAPPANKSAASPGSPMARPVDVAEMTANIEKAESEFKKNPKAKEKLAKAYFIRATALTGAAQYPAALGDYRKGLKLDPNDEAAKSMSDEIVRIFKSLNREPPKEGDEPKPLPIN